ncbi:hypothetical protein NARC_110087 [Candidatus Nitrosocosmicus arcticus]|uniref:Uncharacterized protein n=1 Tax=Candidatus Nitrosocosmicus arcticus TaxID=2035267 RepID=A0A557STG2_9ARCH|nr:hypothetical protein NARC_110087 [Candidatus Nitrosocosmicus arcticus]
MASCISVREYKRAIALIDFYVPGLPGLGGGGNFSNLWLGFAK